MNEDQSSINAFPVFRLFITIVTASYICYSVSHFGISRFLWHVWDLINFCRAALMFKFIIFAPSIGILSTPIQFHRKEPRSLFDNFSSAFQSNSTVFSSTSLFLVYFLMSDMSITLVPSTNYLNYWELKRDSIFGLTILLNPDINA